MSTAELFANLPLVARRELCRHFDPDQMMRLAMKNEKWEEAMGIVDKKTVLEVFIDNIFTRIDVKIFDDDPPIETNNRFDNITILFSKKVDPNAKRITCQITGRKEDEQICQRALRVVQKMFPLFRYDCIRVNIRHAVTADIPFRFLNQLPRGTIEGLEIFADIEIEGNQMIPFLEKMRVERMDPLESDWLPYRNTCLLDFRMKSVMKAKQLFVDVTKLRVKDARMLTGKSMETLTFEEGEFGENDLTSEDFNVFFRRLKNDEAMQDMRKASFKIGKHQNINLEEVLQGLDAKPWDPEVRDRHFLELDHAYYRQNGIPIAIDFQYGRDFYNTSGDLCTVALFEDQLSFHKWRRLFGNLEELEQTADMMSWRVKEEKKKFKNLNDALKNAKREIESAERELRWAQNLLREVKLSIITGPPPGIMRGQRSQS